MADSNNHLNLPSNMTQWARNASILLTFRHGNTQPTALQRLASSRWARRNPQSTIAGDRHTSFLPNSQIFGLLIQK